MKLQDLPYNLFIKLQRYMNIINFVVGDSWAAHGRGAITHADDMVSSYIKKKTILS